MASITTIKTKSGKSYRVTWREGDSQDGKRPQKYETFATMEEARDKRREVEEHIESKRIGSVKREMTHAYLDRWVSELSSDLSPTTRGFYADKIDIAKRALPDMAPLRLKRSDFNKAYATLLESGLRRNGAEAGPLSKQTVKHVHRVLHKAFQDAVKDKLISSNPVKLADPPKVSQGKKYKRKVRAFTAEEARRQIELLMSSKTHSPDTLPMVALFLASGMRRGELCGIADDAMDFQTGKVSIFRNVVNVKNKVLVRETPKTDASVRTIQLPPALLEMLRAQRARVIEGALAWGPGYQRQPLFLFPGPGGEAMNPKMVTRRLMRLMAKAGIDPKDVSPVHSWRHTHGTLLWNAFKNVKQVQERLGHSTPVITMTLYVEGAPEADAEAADFFNTLVKR